MALGNTAWCGAVAAWAMMLVPLMRARPASSAAVRSFVCTCAVVGNQLGGGHVGAVCEGSQKQQGLHVIVLRFV